jgi:hypothetical protein
MVEKSLLIQLHVRDTNDDMIFEQVVKEMMIMIMIIMNRCVSISACVMTGRDGNSGHGERVMRRDWNLSRWRCGLLYES